MAVLSSADEPGAEGAPKNRENSRTKGGPSVYCRWVGAGLTVVAGIYLQLMQSSPGCPMP